MGIILHKDKDVFGNPKPKIVLHRDRDILGKPLSKNPFRKPRRVYQTIFSKLKP